MAVVYVLVAVDEALKELYSALRTTACKTRRKVMTSSARSKHTVLYTVKGCIYARHDVDHFGTIALRCTGRTQAQVARAEHQRTRRYIESRLSAGIHSVAGPLIGPRPR